MLLQRFKKIYSKLNRKSRTLTFIVGFMFGKLVKINRYKISFASDSRDSLSGNMEFVYKELKTRNFPFKFHFFLKKRIDVVESYFSFFMKGYHLSTSKFIVLDDFYPRIYVLKLRKSQELIQLWHAVGAFKTFGYSRVGKPGGPNPNSKDHRNYTKAIVSSNEVRRHYAEGFGIDISKVVATGIPRTDIFFDEQYKQKIQAEIYSRYPLFKDKKTILFAPTFRGNGQSTAYYDFDALDLDAIYRGLSSEYIFVVKMHPFVRVPFHVPEAYKDFFIVLDEKFEINDILFVVDLLITDYSSICFEFSLLNRPMLFFAYDLEDYIRGRDFYYPFSEFVPGDIVKSTNELISSIKNHHVSSEKLYTFRKKFFDHFDGNSSKRVVDELFMNAINE